MRAVTLLLTIATAALISATQDESLDLVAALPLRNQTSVRLRPCNSSERRFWTLNATTGSFLLNNSEEIGGPFGLEVWRNKMLPGSIVDVWQLLYGAPRVNEVWTVVPFPPSTTSRAPNETHKVLLKGTSSGLCVGPHRNTMSSSTQLWPCNESAAVVWTRSALGEMVHEATGLCMVSGPFPACDASVSSACRRTMLESRRWRMAVTVAADFARGQTFVSELYLRQASGIWTPNMVLNTSVNHPRWFIYSHSRMSTTSISVGSEWYPATGGTIESSNGSSLIIKDIRLGDVASERWAISVKGEALSWDVDRTYLKTVGGVNCTRYGNFVAKAERTVGGDTPNKCQIPSTIDPDFTWSPKGVGFTCELGNASSSWQGTVERKMWTYAYSNRSANRMQFSPADMQVEWSKTTSPSADQAMYNFAWQYVPTTVVSEIALSFGIGSSPDSSKTIFNGTTQMVGFALKAMPDEAYAAAPFSIHTLDKRLDSLARNFSRSFNMWSGSMYGNSPASVTCLHELSIFSQIFAVHFPPRNARGLTDLQESFRRMLRMFAENGVEDNGHVWPRWQQYRFWNQPIYGQQPQFLMAFYHYAVTTNDLVFIGDHYNVLMRVLDYLLIEMKMGTEGVATTPGVSGLPYSNVADNWFDIINFGGKDAIINGYAVTVLKAYSELCYWMGDTQRAAHLKKLHEAAVIVYNDLFWNETLGMYGDWIDTDDHRRGYAYLWQQALAVDPASGPIANATRAARIVKELNSLYAKLYAKYNVTTKELWCTPTNFIPVQPGDSYWYLDYPGYEDGTCFTMMSGFEILLRGYGGDPDGAYDLYERVLNQFEKDKLWGQHWNWLDNDGNRYGWNANDVLTDSLMVLYGVARAGFGIYPTLYDGVKVIGRPAKKLENATHTFYHNGHMRTASVRNGKTSIYETEP